MTADVDWSIIDDMPSRFYAYHYAHFHFPLPTQHRYPLPRYVMLHEQALAHAFFHPNRLQSGARAGDEMLHLAHTADYVSAMTNGDISRAEQRRLRLPWSTAVVERARHIVGATLNAAEAAVRDGISFVLGGGTHHAHAAYGSGFCVFNDVAVVARHLQQSGRLGRAAVVDCDVHQGDGTAAILADDEHTFTFSVHGAANFPFEKATSDLDIPLPDGTGDGSYLAAVKRGLAYTLRTAEPDLLFYIAGADPYTADKLGRLNVSAAGLGRRDRHVINICRRRELPVVVLMGGGYSDPIRVTVDLNMQTVATALDLFAVGK